MKKLKPFDRILHNIEWYFATVTREQLRADMKAANFDEYQGIGDPVVFIKPKKNKKKR